MKQLSLLERLADLEHMQWTAWSQTIAEEGLTPERIERWKKLWVDYEDLDEKTKEYDRKWARIALAIIEEFYLQGVMLMGEEDD